MNVIFVTQTGYVRTFSLLEQALGARTDLDKVGYFVSGRKNYRDFLARASKGWEKGRNVLREWEVMDRAAKAPVPDPDAFEALERDIADPTFWNAIVADRRLYFGKKTVYTQDYAPRYSHGRMLAAVKAGLEAVETQIESVRPDAIFSFICVSFIEYLYYLAAKKHGIPYLNLRNTKVENYITAAPDVFEPSANIRQAYETLDERSLDPAVSGFAENFVEGLDRQRVTYEGQGYLDKKDGPALFSREKALRVARAAGSYVVQRVTRPGDIRDNQNPNPFGSVWYDEVVKPLRFKMARRRFKGRFVGVEDLENTPYAFFPLHLEPEISLLTYSRPYLNQIEVVRWLALALPAAWKLVVKDHPKNPFYRSIGFYKKLFEIPNVLMVPHDTSTFDLIGEAKAVLTVSGFVGFEALCRKKPVIALGHTSFEFLPGIMYRRITDPRRIAETLADLWQNHVHDEAALKRYAAAVVSESVRFDWYTIGKTLVKSKAPLTADYLKDSDYAGQFDALAGYLAARV